MYCGIKTRLRIRVIFLFLSIWGSVACSLMATLAQADPGTQLPERPVLLLLSPYEEGTDYLEEDLRPELQMLLDDFTVRFAKIGDITRLPFAEKIKLIRIVASLHRSRVVMWIAPSEDTTATLNMVLLGPGRSTVHSVETARGPDAVPELALAARELLGQVSGDSPKAVDTDKPESPVPSPTQSVPRWWLSSLFRLGNGFYGQTGTSLRIGGKLELERWFRDKFYLRVSLGAEARFTPAFTVPVCFHS